MKKLAIALLGTAALVSAANAEVRTGGYLGLNASVNSLNAKAKINVNQRVGGASVISRTDDMGRHRFGGGIYAGYGFLSGCMYYAGEIGWDYRNNTASLNDTVFGNFSQKFKISNKHGFDFAALIGYRVTPSTVTYIRLGGFISKRKLSYSYTDLANNGLNNASGNKNRTRVTFRPGLGMEVAATRNIMFRIEGTYDIGHSLKATATDRNNNLVHSARATRVSTKTIKAGIAYKF